MEPVAPLSEDEKTAVQVLLGRYNANYHNRAIDQELIATVEARIKSANEQLALVISGLAVFGYSVGEEGVWERIRKEIGAERYNQIVGATTPARSPLLKEAEDLGAELFKAEADASGTESVRDQVLKDLKAAGDKGAKASEIRSLVEKRRGAELHSKTIGMTLYRLSQDGLARRAGTTWFFVLPEAEKKNPGGETPGPSNVSN